MFPDLDFGLFPQELFISQPRTVNSAAVRLIQEHMVFVIMVDVSLIAIARAVVIKEVYLVVRAFVGEAAIEAVGLLLIEIQVEVRSLRSTFYRV